LDYLKVKSHDFIKHTTTHALNEIMPRVVGTIPYSVCRLVLRRSRNSHALYCRTLVFTIKSIEYATIRTF